MKIIITGIRGQDGKILRALLAADGHQVLGIDRARPGATAVAGTEIAALDLCDEDGVSRLVAEYQPDQIYHLAACHHSSEQRGDPATDREMVRTNFMAVERLLSAIATRRPQCRLLVAGSSQMYSRIADSTTVVDEATAMAPATFYGWTKAWSRNLLAHYRQRWGIFGSMAILFNHESVERPPHFLSRKISQAVARITEGLATDLEIRDVDAEVDWSSARDVVDGIRLILGHENPGDYVLASGRTRRVAELLEIAFGSAGLDWKSHVKVSSGGRADRAGALVGDPRRAERELGWQRKESFEGLIREMVDNDRRLLQRVGR